MLGCTGKTGLSWAELGFLPECEPAARRAPPGGAEKSPVQHRGKRGDGPGLPPAHRGCSPWLWAALFAPRVFQTGLGGVDGERLGVRRTPNRGQKSTAAAEGSARGFVLFPFLRPQNNYGID